MPYNVVMNINKDPKTKMAFNWFTNAGVTGGQVQIVQGTAIDETSFASPLMVINAKCDSVKNLNYNVSANGLLALAGIANNTKKSYTRNRVLASGLTPNTKYSYRVGKNGAWSTIGSFTTAKATKEPFSFVYVTDPQAQTDEMFNVSQRTTHAAQTRYPNANFWLSCGDLIETSGTSNSEWEYEQFFETQQDILMNNPIAPNQGNHDISTNKNWMYHFNTDSTAFDYAKSTVPGSIYSYVYGDALIMSMSYENYSTAGYLDSLANWMTAQVNAHPEVKWRIANFHKTMYTGSSSHQSDADGKAVRDRMAPVFDTLKIDLALEGHDHIYEIMGPIKNKALVPGEVSNQTSVTPNTTDNLTGKLGGKFDVNRGTLYFLNNSAGKKKYLPRNAAQMDAAFAATQITNYFGLFSGRFGQDGLPTFSNITVSTDSITISTYSVDDLGNSVLFDAFSIVKTPKAFAVTGTGNYCQGTNGLAVGLAGSELGITYTITPGGATMAGTGSAISFGNKLAGTYTISGTNSTGTTVMTGSAVITEIQIPAAPTSTGDYYSCSNVSGTVNVTVPSGSVAKWYDATNTLVNTGNSYSPGLVTATYNVESYTTLAGCVSTTRTAVIYSASGVTATINNPTLYETSNSGLTDHITVNASTGFPNTYSLTFAANAITAGFVNTPALTPYTTNQIVINIPVGVLAGNYNATLTLRNAGGCIVSKTITIIFPAIEPVLTITKTKDIGTTCAMAWDASTLIAPNAADPATLFTFQYRKVNTTTWIGASSASNSIKLTNLTPNTNYECRVYTYKKYQAPSPLAGTQYQFSISKIANFTTTTITYTKSQEIGTNDLISWNNGTNDLTSFATTYTFQYKKASASVWVGLSASTPQGKMANTDTSAVYNCQVSVYIGGVLWGTTAAGNITTGKVTYTVSNRAATSLKLAWNEVPANTWSPAPTYTLQYKLTTSSTWIGISTGTVAYTNLYNLTNGATYNCRVVYYLGSAQWGICNEGTFKAGLTAKNEITTSNNATVYPNPFVDGINLDLFTEQGTKVNWNIYDLTGKVVLTGNEEITSGYSTLKIDASGLSKGVYMLNAIMDNQMQNFRIIKQ